LLLALNRSGTFFHQVARARLLLLRELQLRLGLVELRLRLLDLFLLAVDLRLDVADVGLRHGNLRLRLIDRDLVVTVVDPRQKFAGVDVLVVGDRDGGDIAANLRRNPKAPGRDEGVIGRFVMTDVEPINEAADHGDQEHAGPYCRDDPMVAQPIPQRGRLCRRLVMGLPIRRGLLPGGPLGPPRFLK
jgi:hypothetical protein